MGNEDLVVELQHSPIDQTDIQAREEFYGSMVWLFDATERFRMVRSGSRVFFSFGRVKHIERCRKPVFLDFGSVVVQVETFTTVLDKCSGFGLARDRRWFVDQHLSQKSRGGSVAPNWTPSAVDLASNPWKNECPYRTTSHSTRWRIDGEQRLFPARTKYLPLNYSWRIVGTGKSHRVWDDIIQKFPNLANGWTEGSILEMKQLLNGTPMIFEGVLRVMPSAEPSTFNPGGTLGVAEDLLRKADEHMFAGRIPILKPATKEQLLHRARAAEVARQSRRSPTW